MQNILQSLDFNTFSSGILLILASLGLSLSAGVRAYLPVLALGIAADIGNVGGFQIHLQPEFAWVGNPLFLGLMVLLTIYEISADKIPVVDHLNDTVHTLIRPLSGALIFVSTNNLLTDHGAVGMIAAAVLGGGLAATTHAVKAGVVRPASTVATLGLANPVISLGEDVLVIFTTIVSLLAPVVGIILIALVAVFIGRRLNKVAKNRRAKQVGVGDFATGHPYP